MIFPILPSGNRSKNKPITEQLKSLTFLLWSTNISAKLRQIYYAFKFEAVQRRSQNKLRNTFYRQYQENLQEYQYYSDFVKRWNENIQNAGTYRSEILKTSDIVEKYTLAVKCISAMTGDEPFLKTALEQLKGVSE